MLVMAAARTCVCGQSPWQGGIAPPAQRLFPVAEKSGSLRNDMTVAVYNYAGAPDSVLLPAMDMARQALSASRVSSRWVICEPERCREKVLPGSYLELILLPRLQPVEGIVRGHPAGYAFRGTLPQHRAYASYDSARQVSEWKLRPVQLVLACILLHETGHLLGLRHGVRGAMRANLEGEDMDDVVRGRAFTAAEGAQLRVAVQ
jgi:hypothetical protein